MTKVPKLDIEYAFHLFRAGTGGLVVEILGRLIRGLLSEVYGFGFRRGLWTPPLPAPIKRLTIAEHGEQSEIWVETGTYLGETTKFLARKFPLVISIEPSAELFSRAKRRLERDSKVLLLFGTSEDRFSEALSMTSGKKVGFWLDGHYSGGLTFQGDQETPVQFELDLIEKNLDAIKVAVICIDDVRVFDEDRSYPSKTELVDWATKNKFSWDIISDIFIMKPLHR